ncbi:hypothetical protein VM94_04334 [Janthinobacterium sp. KBS0711]|uniref:Cap15 family cyclic dinucleotide receptor domain-containing protein n=1 Tax=Janthinobacterium sp. KBS0711 TaxID=1649647 RepID=UPI000638B66E|nr:hypothetical protein [Janthinobacterium sp. KBS0711]KKO62260.1 hypothetical protein VM94_04334 [Janthinobacterium sp. KBS0711]TSD72234.1 hypothetical protein FFI39_015350 [Janthinobacterium sp. KBS0711]
MITLLPLNRVIAGFAVFYGIVVSVIVGIATQQSDATHLYKNMKIAMTGSAALSLVLLFMFHIGWKWLWSMFPRLNTIFFPNLQGTWRMTIHYVVDGKKGEVVSQATIKQDFVKISMEVESPGSHSKTLIAQPKKDSESGLPLLYYVYQVEPKQVNASVSSPYTGSAILQYRNTTIDTLSGNYFTSRNTYGRFVLERV